MLSQGRSNVDVITNSEITFDLFPTNTSKAKLKKHKNKLLNSIQSLFVSQDICEELTAKLERASNQDLLKLILVSSFFWLSFVVALIVGLTLNTDEGLTTAQWIFVILLSTVSLVLYLIQGIYSLNYFSDWKRYFSDYDANKTFEIAKNAPMYLEFRMYYQISVNGSMEQYFVDQKLYPEHSQFSDRVYSYGKKSKLKVIENFYLLDQKSVQVLNSKLNVFVVQNQKRTSKQFTGCQVILESEKSQGKKNIENQEPSTSLIAVFGILTAFGIALPMLVYMKKNNPPYTLYLIKGVSFL